MMDKHIIVLISLIFLDILRGSESLVMSGFPMCEWIEDDFIGDVGGRGSFGSGIKVLGILRILW